MAVDDDARLVPLTSSTHGCFQRARLLSGQVIEDQLEYSKCAEILHKLLPKPAQEEQSKMGFPFNQADYGAVGDDPYQPNKQRQHINAGSMKRVWHKPNFGLFRQNKWLPTDSQ